jgi:hypothetical protein
MGPFSIRNPPITAPKTTTIPIIANIFYCPLAEVRAWGSTDDRTFVVELRSKVLKLYRLRLSNFPEN